MIYLASPYSNKMQTVETMRYREVFAITKQLIEDGVDVFSPICYGYQFGNEIDWLKFDLEMLSKCSEFWIVPLEGWNESDGIQKELDQAREMNIPIKIVTI